MPAFQEPKTSGESISSPVPAHLNVVKYLTVSDVARRLQFNPATVYRLVDSGRLPHHRVGNGRGAIRISEDDLALYLASCRFQESRTTAKAPTVNQKTKLKHLRLS